MEDIVGQMTGWDMAIVAAVFVLARQVMEFIGKVIPDSSTGALGIVRRVAKALALYVPNKQ